MMIREVQSSLKVQEFVLKSIVSLKTVGQKIMVVQFIPLGNYVFTNLHSSITVLKMTVEPFMLKAI